MTSGPFKELRGMGSFDTHRELSCPAMSSTRNTACLCKVVGTLSVGYTKSIGLDRQTAPVCWPYHYYEDTVCSSARPCQPIEQSRAAAEACHTMS